jgi:hypothetical protein
MAAPVVSPELQWCDANGTPYAGGSIATFVPGTSTPKSTWLDPELSALNENPLTLDGAGRSLMYADGDVRLILRDALGNQIFDVEATSIVSAAMAPVVSAPTIADAVDLLGLGDASASEAAARAAADSAEQSARIAADNAEATTRGNADTTLQANIDAERTRAMAAEAALTGGLPGKIQYGQNVTDSDGHKRVTFGSAYSSNPAVSITQTGSAYDVVSVVATSNTTGFDVWLAFPGTSAPTPAGPRPFYWMAIGPA